MPRNYKTNLFQRRQYEWLAETIRNLPSVNVGAETGTDADIDIRRVVALEFANALRGSNPGFDRERFLNACKPSED